MMTTPNFFTSREGTEGCVSPLFSDKHGQTRTDTDAPLRNEAGRLGG